MLKPLAPQAEALSERMQLIQGVSHQMAPLLAAKPQPALVDVNSHCAKSACNLHIIVFVKDSSNTAKQLGWRIRETRLRKRLTLAQVAEKSGVHYTQISRVERGLFRFAAPNVRKICKVLGIGDTQIEAVDLEYLCERVCRTIKTPQSQLAMNAFLDAIELTGSSND